MTRGGASNHMIDRWIDGWAKPIVDIRERRSENRRASYTLNFLRIQAHDLSRDTVISKVLVDKVLWYVVE